MANRPNLRSEQAAKRSFEQAATVLQEEILEKQAVNASVHDEMRVIDEFCPSFPRQIRDSIVSA